MKNLLCALWIVTVLGVSVALAQEQPRPQPPPPPPVPATEVEPEQQLTPPTPPPSAAPGQAPTEIPPPPVTAEGQPPEPEEAGAAEAQPPPPPPGVPAGQWVFTNQYGWVWMPYAQNYTYVPAGGDPYMYVYYPTNGWRWVSAPWVYGWGPRPYWGMYGVRRYVWYAHPWFKVSDYRGHHPGTPHAGYRRAPSGGTHSARPASHGRH
jgi:hypothetical protein